MESGDPPYCDDLGIHNLGVLCFTLQKGAHLCILSCAFKATFIF